MKSKLILLNGDRNCGKSTLTAELHRFFHMKDRQCKERLHELTRLFFNVPESIYWDLYNDPVKKEVPSGHYILTRAAHKALMDYLYEDDKQDYPYVNDSAAISPREALIYTSEILVKPTFGKDYFGQYRANQIGDNELAIDDSAGFLEELPPVIEKLGQENIILIRITGRGNSAKGDSRVRIPDGIIENTIEIKNDDSVSLSDYLSTGVAHILQFIGKDKQYVRDVRKPGGNQATSVHRQCKAS